MCGLFLSFVILSPLKELEFDHFVELSLSLHEEGERISEAAVLDVSQEIAAVIIEKVESYILVEADAVGAVVRVESVELDEQTMEPVAITLSGDISPYKRKLLTRELEEKLGIGKERQIWNGKSWSAGSENTNTP